MTFILVGWGVGGNKLRNEERKNENKKECIMIKRKKEVANKSNTGHKIKSKKYLELGFFPFFF